MADRIINYGFLSENKTAFFLCDIQEKFRPTLHRFNDIVQIADKLTHVCVEQTAAELMARGIQVHIVADACTSRSQDDRLLAFQRLRQIGCFISTFENVIYKLLGDTKHPQFVQVRPLIKQTSPNTGLAGMSKI